jgi:single-strand DNA-binding protein
MATSRNWTSPEGEKRSATDWFNVVAWGNLAEICSQYLKKGQQVFVEGRLQTRTWQDDSGNKRSAVEVVARELLMLGERRDKMDEAEQNESADDYPEGEDEFPF